MVFIFLFFSIIKEAPAFSIQSRSITCTKKHISKFACLLNAHRKSYSSPLLPRSPNSTPTKKKKNLQPECASVLTSTNTNYQHISSYQFLLFVFHPFLLLTIEYYMKLFFFGDSQEETLGHTP